MTSPEVDIAKCKAAAVRCDCGGRPVFTYVPGLSTITCSGKCDFAGESLPDWCPGSLTRRWNARILGPDKFQELGYPGLSLETYRLTEQVKIECERNGLFNDTD